MELRFINLRYVMILKIILYVTISIIFITWYEGSRVLTIIFLLGLCVLEISSHTVLSFQQEESKKEAQVLSSIILRSELHKKEVSEKIHKDLGGNLLALKLYMYMPSSSKVGLNLVNQKVQSIFEDSFKAQKEIVERLSHTGVHFDGLHKSIENLLPGKIYIKNDLIEKKIHSELFSPLYCLFREIISLIKKGNEVNKLLLTPIETQFGVCVNVEVDESRLGTKRIDKLLRSSREIQEWLLIINAKLKIEHLGGRRTRLRLRFNKVQSRSNLSLRIIG